MQRSRPNLTQCISAAVDIWSYGVTCAETIRGGASLFAGSGCEVKTGKIIVDFARSTAALEKFVGTLPKSMGSLSGIHEIVGRALSKTPGERSLIIAMR